MARIELAPEVLDDVDCFVDHLAQHAAQDVQSRIGEIVQAIQILAHSPLIGRTVKGGKRELVIGKGVRGYVALYRYVASLDTVVVLAIRHQREFGYKPER